MTMIRKIFSIALLTISLGYATHTFAFGAILEAITDAVVQGVVGPGDGNFPSPPQKDRLINIVDQNNIKYGSKDKVITGTACYKLAIIKSANVDEQINAYQKFVEWYLKLIKSYASNSAPLISEANTFISGNQYYEKAVGLLKSRFSSTVEAKNLKEAFEQGADYVAIIDIKLEFKTLNKPDSPITNTADISMLVIDKMLNAAPDILIQNTVVNNYEGTGPDENFKKETAFLKAARDKTLSKFETQLNKVIIAEADDPPVKGIRLELSNTVESTKPKIKAKQKSKKKN